MGSGIRHGFNHHENKTRDVRAKGSQKEISPVTRSTRGRWQRFFRDETLWPRETRSKPFRRRSGGRKRVSGEDSSWIREGFCSTAASIFGSDMLVINNMYILLMIKKGFRSSPYNVSCYWLTFDNIFKEKKISIWNRTWSLKQIVNNLLRKIFLH